MSREWFDDDPDIVGAGYYVHYKGWKSTYVHHVASRLGYVDELLLFNRWDEWVPESRVLRLNDTNLAMQSKLKELYTVGYMSYLNIKYGINLSHLT